MKKAAQLQVGGRSTSNSAEASSRLKKSASSGFSNKMKSSITSTNCLDSSVKPARPNQASKSNKKDNLITSNSNKSLKSLNEIHSQSHLESSTKTMPRKIEAVVGPSDKKSTAVPIKSLKQKALGNPNPSSIIQSYKAQCRNTEEKENQT